jgi:hypothetical protein
MQGNGQRSGLTAHPRLRNLGVLVRRIRAGGVRVDILPGQYLWACPVY